jgi:hypothetical protein
MKVLHILKQEPSDTIKKIIETHSKENEVKIVELYKGEPNYKELVDLIFNYDKVICW